METDRFNVARGKSFDLKLNIMRGDYKGPIKLTLEGIESLRWTNNVVAEGKTNATMKVTLPDNFAPAAPLFFSVLGTAQRDGAELRARASVAPALRRRFPQLLYVPAELDGEAVLLVTAE